MDLWDILWGGVSKYHSAMTRKSVCVGVGDRKCKDESQLEGLIDAGAKKPLTILFLHYQDHRFAGLPCLPFVWVMRKHSAMQHLQTSRVHLSHAAGNAQWSVKVKFDSTWPFPPFLSIHPLISCSGTSHRPSHIPSTTALPFHSELCANLASS